MAICYKTTKMQKQCKKLRFMLPQAIEIKLLIYSHKFTSDC